MSHTVILIVANEPSAQREEEYNEWYNQKHIPMMFRYHGMKKASRYRLTGESRDASKYIAIYEFGSEQDLKEFFKSAEYAAAVEDFDEKWKAGGFENRWNDSYTLIKSWEKIDSTR